MEFPGVEAQHFVCTATPGHPAVHSRGVCAKGREPDNNAEDEETSAQHRNSWDKMRQMGMNKIEDTEEMERDDAMKVYDILRMNDDIL